MATRQDGVAAEWHLLELGLSKQAIRRRVRSGRLVRRYPGVYSVGHEALTPRGRALAAAWACGPHGLLSHQAAAQRWGILRSARAVWDVTVPATGRRKIKGIRVHRVRNLHPEDRAEVDGVPVTSLARTLLDLAAAVPMRRLQKAVEAAEREDLLDLRAIERLLARARGHKGRSSLIQALRLYREPPPFTRSDLERRVHDLCVQAGALVPAFNACVAGYEVDALWEEKKLILEIDTYATHGGPAAFERDRERDLVLEDLGYQVARVTDRMIEDGEWFMRWLHRKGL